MQLNHVPPAPRLGASLPFAALITSVCPSSSYSQDGEVIHVHHPKNEVAEVVMFKKALASIFSGKYRSRTSPIVTEGATAATWRYVDRDSDHNGEHTSE